MRPVRVQDITTAFLDCGGSFCHDKTGRANIFFLPYLEAVIKPPINESRAIKSFIFEADRGQ